MPYYIGLSDLPSVCRPRETLLVFKETKNMLMGSSYELRESQGDVIIHIRAHAVTLHDSKGRYCVP
jgi:hypothetical protein